MNTRSRRRWIVGAGLAALAALPLAGCGGEADGEGAAAERTSFLGRWWHDQPVRRTVPAGTVLIVALEDGLSSHESEPGQSFGARVTQGVSIGGREVIPAGSRIVGTVTEATPARKIGGRSLLKLEFHRLELPWGHWVDVSAGFARAGRSEVGKDAAIIGASTLGGAILGEAVDKGQGGVIGAIVGGIGGAVAAARTHGKPVEVAAGARLDLELLADVTVELPEAAAGGRRKAVAR